VGAPASIRREVEDSLRRLGVERIDLYQMHWPADDGTSLAEYWQTSVFGNTAQCSDRRTAMVPRP
jgi:aryl-alcohol dehydrogenase-like predicted oxidoreductase